jgi:hypothetical protein
MNNLPLLLLCLIASVHLAGQTSEWSEKPSIGFYYTPLKMERYALSSGLSPDERIYESTANVMGTLPINAKLRLGLQYMLVTTAVIREPKDRSQLLGFTAQYNFTARRRLGLYLEGGYTVGNFCPCGIAEPYTSDTLNHFRSLGVGIDYRMTSKLHLKAGFINYTPLKKHNDVYNWTQPFVGINFYFADKYKTPFKSRFIKKNEPLPKEARSFYWKDGRKRTWNIGLTSSGAIATQHEPFPDQPGNVPLLRYREFSISPRVNYWINQAILLGVQGTFYHYENNFNNILPQANGLGVGLQARFYPLNFKKPGEFRSIRIGKRANWQISPIMGVEVRAANFSWMEPEQAGKSWQYYDWQPFVGYTLSYKRWFNLFATVGPTVGFPQTQATSPINGIRVVGLEYNFSR